MDNKEQWEIVKKQTEKTPNLLKNNNNYNNQH